MAGASCKGTTDGTGAIVSRRNPVRTGGGPHQGCAVGAHARYVVYKGSVAVDGVSLTVSGLSDSGPPWFEVSLIPETLQRTTLGFRQPGAEVNLEVDLIAKYVERLLAGRLQ